MDTFWGLVEGSERPPPHGPPGRPLGRLCVLFTTVFRTCRILGLAGHLPSAPGLRVPLTHACVTLGWGLLSSHQASACQRAPRRAPLASEGQLLPGEASKAHLLTSAPKSPVVSPWPGTAGLTLPPACQPRTAQGWLATDPAAPGHQPTLTRALEASQGRRGPCRHPAAGLPLRWGPGQERPSPCRLGPLPSYVRRPFHR